MVVQGTASAAATSVTIPAHAAGDLILVMARGTAAAPTQPSAGGTVPTWLSMQSAFANALGLTTRYCIATTSSHTTGVWTNATHICVLVLRPGAGGTLSIGGSAPTAANNTQTIVYPALTFTKTDGTSWSVRCGTRTVADSEVGTSLPAGYTNQIIQPAGASALMAVHTRSGITSSPTADSVATTGTNAAYRAHTIEVVETIPPAFPTGLVDDFNRANQYPPGSRWAGSFRANGLQVLSNQLTNVADLWDGMYWNSLAVADPEVSATVVTPGVAGEFFQLQLRCVFAVDTAYIFSFSPTAVEVYRRIAGADVLIASNYTLTIAAGDVVGASVIGTAVKAWHKSGSGAYAAVATATNSEITAAGVVAIYSNGGWVVDDLYSGPPPLTLDASDTVALADALSQVQGFADTFVDAVAVVDLLDPSYEYPLALVDTIVSVDDLQVALPLTLELADSVGFGGLFPGAFYPGTRYPGGSDLLYIGEPVPVLITEDDVVALSDSLVVDVFVPIDVPLADALALVDSLTIDMALALGLADTVALVDSLAVNQGFDLTLSDTLALADALTLDMPGSVSVDQADIVTPVDLLDLVAAYSDVYADTLSLVDSLTSIQDIVSTLAADTVALVDSVSLDVVTTLAFADTLVPLVDEISFDIQRQWLIPIPEEDEDLVSLPSGALVLTPEPEDTRELVPTGGDVPLATALPESSLVLTPIPEGEH